MNHRVRSSNKKQVIATAIVCSFLLVLPSCRIPCLREAPPGPNLPETFNGRVSADNSAEVAVPEFFQDPNLISLIDEALVGNQQLKILAEDIQIANNEVLARRGAYLPFFNFGGRAAVASPSLYTPEGALENQLQSVPGLGFPNPLPDFMIGTEVSWQVDIWRKLRNARDAAALRYLGTTEGRNYIVTRIVAEVAENYYGLMALDKRLEVLDSVILLQEKSLDIARARKDAARGTELPVQRFLAEVRRNNSEKLIIQQDIVEAENRINFLLGRFPMPVERSTAIYIDLNMHTLSLGVPSQLLQNRPDIRQAERELAAAGLDVKVARARFYPSLNITGQVGFEAFNPRYLFFTPESIVGGVAGSLMAPVINRNAIKADYLTANARQLQAVVNYQKVTLTAFTEVINRISKVENYGKSIEIKKQQLESLEVAVDAANKLFQNARTEYLDVLFAQRDLRDARTVLIETKREQLVAIVNTYQALGGGGGGLVPIFGYESAAIPPEPAGSEVDLPEPTP
jgi:multidrug efflux system outer membrane protein